MTPAEALRALCTLRQELPEEAAVTLPLAWLSEALEGSAPTSAPPAGVLTIADLSVGELAHRYGRKASTIRGWLERGMFPGAFKLRGRDWRAPASAIEAFDRAERERELKAHSAHRPRRVRTVDLGAWRKEA